MRKTFLTILLAAVASIGTIFADVYSGTCGENLNWTLNTETGVLDISGSGAMKNFSGGSLTPWSSYVSYIKTVSLPEDLTTIGNYAFCFCSKLSSITIPNNVQSIGVHAFRGCKSLESVTIGEGVTVIGGSAFSGCTNLASVIIGESVTNIGEDAFYNTSITSITIPNSVKTIGNTAFSHCTSLQSVTFGENLSSVAGEVFSSCTSLTTIVWNVTKMNLFVDYNVYNNIFGQGDIPSQITSFTFGQNVEQIPATLCYGMTNLQSVTIPDGVTSIGDYAFKDCISLSSVNIPNTIQTIGEFAFKNCKSLPVIEGCRYADTYLVDAADADAKQFIVKEGTKWIGNAAFKDHKNIEKIQMPNSVTIIETAAFANDSALNEIIWSDNLLTIKSSAFMSCVALTNIVFPASLKSIEYQAFNQCANLKSITLPEGMENIGTWAFCGCTSLGGTLVIPEGITKIENNTFRRCAFSDIVFPSTLIEIGEQAFYDNRARIKHLVIPDNVIKIGSSAFYYSTPTKLTIGKNIAEIGQYAFNYEGWSPLDTIVWNAVNGPTPFIGANNNIRSHITHITIGEDVETLPDLFYNLPQLKTIEWNAKHATDLSSYLVGGTTTQLKKVTINPTVEYIPANFCKNMANVADIYLPNSVTEVGENAFVGCTGLENIHYSGSLEEWCDGIYADIMQEWNGGNLIIETDTLKELVIPEDVNEIVTHGFAKCKSLTSVYIPDHVQKIGEQAFSDCENVQSVILGHGLTSLPAGSFNNCKALTALTLGKNIKTVYDNAFYGCENIEAIYNYREKPGVLYSTSFDGVDKFSCILYVPAGSLAMYKAAAGWKDFFDIREMGAGIEDNADIVQIVTTDNTATFNWNNVDDANTYTLVIWADAEQTEMFCSLTFNASGYLTNINFGDAIKRAPSRIEALSGLSFTVTGLEGNHQYNFELKALAENETVLDIKNGTFITNGQIFTGVDEISESSNLEILKIIKHGNLYILRNGEIFNATGARVE